MKSKNTLKTVLSAALCLFLTVTSSCAQPPKEQDIEQSVRNSPTPYLEDGTCYTQTVSLSDFTLDQYREPRFCVVGDTLLFMDTDLSNGTPIYSWNLTANTIHVLSTPAPLLSIDSYDMHIRAHLPLPDGSTVQLLEAVYLSDAYLQTDFPESDAGYDVQNLLVIGNSDGSIRLNLDVDALFDDGFTHVAKLYRDDTTGYLYLFDQVETVVILDADGNLLDRLPWEFSRNAILTYGADNRVFVLERPTDTAVWIYSMYDAAAHAFVPAHDPNWIGYAIHPSANGAWYEHTPAGLVIREKTENDEVSETLLVDWIRSGYTNASIRKTYVDESEDGTMRLFAVTQGPDRMQSFTLFDPYETVTPSARREILLAADRNIYTLQEAVADFNAENELYRVVYTEDPASADLLYVSIFSPLPSDTAVLDLYTYLDTDLFLRKPMFLPNALNAFEDDSGALRVLCTRMLLQLDTEDPNDKHACLTSAADWLASIAAHADIPEKGSIGPVIGFAIREDANDPLGAWKFIRHMLLAETEETLRSGADEGFSVLWELFEQQLDRMDGAYAAVYDHRITFTYPPVPGEAFDPMTDPRYAAAAAKENVHFACFDADNRNALKRFFLD